MAKMQCECGSYLFYVYTEVYGSKIVCIREENAGHKSHKAMIKEKEVLSDV